MARSPRTVALAVLLVLAAVLSTGCTQEEAITVRVSEHPTYGTILTDSAGRSLYVQARDVPNTGAIADIGELERFYPPFFAETVDSQVGIDISAFGYLTRADGRRQTTFRGWPLYYYLNDKEPGDAKSHGANNLTFLAKPDYTVMVREDPALGVYLTDTEGVALLVSDRNTTPAGADGPAPFHATPLVGPSPLVQTPDFGQTGDGTQTTFRGLPLYLNGAGAGRSALAGVADGFRPVILAPAGSSAVPAATPTAPPGPTGGATAAPTAEATATATPTGTRSAYDPYTGGSYTPTPTTQVVVVRRTTASATTVAPGTTVPPTTLVTTTVPPSTIVTTTVPTTFPPLTLPPTVPPTEVPTEPPTVPPTEVPTEPPTAPPTEAPTEPPTAPPTEIPTEVPTEPPTAPPTTLAPPIPTETSLPTTTFPDPLFTIA